MAGKSGWFYWFNERGVIIESHKVMFTSHQAATTGTSRCSIWQTLHDGLRVFLPSWLFFKWVVLGQNKLKSGPALHFTTSLYSCLSEQVQAVFGISTSLTCPELRNVLLKFDTFLLSMPLCLMWFLEQYKILCCCWSNIPYKLPIWLSRWCSCVNMQKKRRKIQYRSLQEI